MEKYFGNAYRGDPGVPHAARIGSSTFGSGRPPSPPSLGLTLTSGLSPTNSTGTTEQCFFNNITGRKHVRRINRTNSSGIKWTKPFEIRTTSTGQSTSHSLLTGAGV